MHRTSHWIILAFVAPLAGCSDDPSRETSNLLKSRVPIEVHGVTHPERLTDGEPASPLPKDIVVRSKMLHFGLSLVIFLFLTYRKARVGWVLACLLIPLAGSVDLIRTLHWAWPIGARQVSFFRAVIAGTAGLAIVRKVLTYKRFQSHTHSVNAVLEICAILSFMAFYNLGHPQFIHHKNNKRTYLHYPDLRHYFPTAKYFNEVGYHDTYIADAAAYIEDTQNGFEVPRRASNDVMDFPHAIDGKHKGEVLSMIPGDPT